MRVIFDSHACHSDSFLNQDPNDTTTTAMLLTSSVLPLPECVSVMQSSPFWLVPGLRQSATVADWPGTLSPQDPRPKTHGRPLSPLTPGAPPLRNQTLELYRAFSSCTGGTSRAIRYYSKYIPCLALLFPRFRILSFLTLDLLLSLPFATLALLVPYLLSILSGESPPHQLASSQQR